MGSDSNMQGGFVKTDIPTTAEGMKAKLFNMGTIITLVAGLLVLVGSFLAWRTISEMGFSLSLGIGDFAGNGYPEVWIVPIMGILIMLMPFIKFPIGSTIMGIIAMLIPIEALSRTGGFSYIGIGVILAIVGGLIAIFGGLIAHKISKAI